MSFFLKRVTLFLFLPIVGCSSLSSNMTTIGEPLRGVYFDEFERQEFITCDGVRFWVSNPSKVRELTQKEGGKPLQISAVIRGAQAFSKIEGFEREISILSAEISDNQSACGIVEQQK